MSETVAQSIIVGCVAIFSALIGGTLPHFLQRRTKEVDIKRDKIEQISEEMRTWFNNAYGLYALQFRLFFDGHIDWNAFLDMTISRTTEGNISKATLLAQIYFPQVHAAIKNVHTAVMDLASYINNDIASRYKAGESLYPMRITHQRKVELCDSLMRELDNIISSSAKRLR